MICGDTPTYGWVYGWLGGCVGQWMGSGQITKNWINLDWLRYFNFVWKFMICEYTLTHGWVYEWLGGQLRSGQITKNGIDLDLIEIIQFCLKIYDLWRHPHLWVGVWVCWWMGHSFDILRFDFLLKPPQPITGLFFIFFILITTQ